MGAARKVDVDKALERIRKHGPDARRDGGGRVVGVDLTKYRAVVIPHRLPAGEGLRKEAELGDIRDRLGLRELEYSPAAELGFPEARHTTISEAEIWLCPIEVWRWRKAERTRRAHENKTWLALQKSRRGTGGPYWLNKRQLAELPQ